MKTDLTDAPIEIAPDFSAVDIQGQTVSLSGFRGKQHVVLVFNRSLA